jgi:hypothetical protein
MTAPRRRALRLKLTTGSAFGQMFKVSVVCSPEMSFVAGFQKNDLAIKKQPLTVQLKFKFEAFVLRSVTLFVLEGFEEQCVPCWTIVFN